MQLRFLGATLRNSSLWALNFDICCKIFYNGRGTVFQAHPGSMVARRMTIYLILASRPISF
jgi:hypothetical protein